MITLNNLISAGKDRKRVGRGGGRGGTSGRGHKGQKARTSGTVRLGFEGGQMPLYRRIPKRGFNNKPFQDVVYIVDVARLNAVCTDGQEVTREFLVEKGLISERKSVARGMVKLLGNTDLSKKLIIHVDACSEAARALVAKCGGEVRLSKES
jgi:large subunit ribosomal protein L15